MADDDGNGKRPPHHQEPVPSDNRRFGFDLKGVGAAAQTPPPDSKVPSSDSDAPTLFDSSSVVPSPSSSGETVSFFGVHFLQRGRLLGGRYAILRVLGEGGMGAVYLARDTELDRVIALKVIRPELAGDPAILQRFKQELILARHITHKNVIRIFDLGEADGIRFITMEYVDGEDLRTLLRRSGKFDAGEAVDTAVQICRALDAAHSEGVIHRDLKPQNVMRDTHGRIVVMDFGLARSLESNGVTQTGALVGTLEYMSPEQALGGQLDQRSDLFAVGLILFEMLTGKVPYKADTAIASLMRRTQERAASASDADPSVPLDLSQIVGTCLERNPNDRYSSAQELLRELEAWHGSPQPSPRVEHRGSAAPARDLPPQPGPRSVQINLNLPTRRVSLWTAIFAVLLIAFFSIPSTRHLVFPQAVQVSVAPAAQGIPPFSQGKYLTVLPLKILGDSSLRYVADGIGDALSAKLFQLRELHLVSSPPAAETADNAGSNNNDQQSVVKIAQSVGANLVLRGAVQGSAGKLRITLNLEDAVQGRRMWSQEFSGLLPDLLALEDKIYGSVVQGLDLQPSGEELARGGVHPTENMAAYDLYLKGRDALRGKEGRRNTEAGIDFMERALQQDSNFALAYTGISDANLRLYRDSKDGLFAEKALAAAQKAESINSNLPEVHLSLGSVYTATGRNMEAIAELKRALLLTPASDEAYRRLADAYRAGGSRPAAIAAYQSAVRSNPYYWYNHNRLGGAYLGWGENDKALEEFQQVTRLAPDNPIGYQNQGAVFLRLGRWNDSIPVFEKALDLQPDAGTYSNLGTAYFYLKRYEDSIRMMEKAVEMSPKDEQLAGNLADSYRTAGHTQQANSAYDKAIQLAFQQLQVNPKSAEVTGDLALYYSKKGSAVQALQYIRQARSLDPADVQLVYDQAQIYASADKQKEALASLKEAFQRGYPPDEAQSDPELARLKALPEFTRLVSQYSRKSN
jgi:eukaryotic-like serine/threonine-protein kinase